MIDLQAIRKNLEEKVGVEEAYVRYQFEIWRKGGKYDVSLYDRGPECQAILRYYATVKSPTGKCVTGNSAANPLEAIDIAHWSELD